jgi:hypothetical protein
MGSHSRVDLPDAGIIEKGGIESLFVFFLLQGLLVRAERTFCPTNALRKFSHRAFTFCVLAD